MTFCTLKPNLGLNTEALQTIASIIPATGASSALKPNANAELGPKWLRAVKRSILNRFRLMPASVEGHLFRRLVLPTPCVAVLRSSAAPQQVDPRTSTNRADADRDRHLHAEEAVHLGRRPEEGSTPRVWGRQRSGVVAGHGVANTCGGSWGRRRPQWGRCRPRGRWNVATGYGKVAGGHGGVRIRIGAWRAPADIRGTGSSTGSSPGGGGTRGPPRGLGRGCGRGGARDGGAAGGHKAAAGESR